MNADQVGTYAAAFILLGVLFLLGAEIAERRRRARLERAAEQVIRDAAASGALMLDALAVSLFPGDERRDYGLEVFRTALAQDRERDVADALVFALRSMARRATARCNTPRACGYAARLQGIARQVEQDGIAGVEARA